MLRSIDSSEVIGLSITVHVSHFPGNSDSVAIFSSALSVALIDTPFVPLFPTLLGFPLSATRLSA